MPWLKQSIDYMKKVSVIGAGFSSLSAACYLAKQGYSVEIFEKNPEI